MTLIPSTGQAAPPDRELYEVRSYLLGDKGDAKAIDAYLKDALIPALNRHGIKPVGVFTNSENDESGSERIVVVIPYSDAAQILATRTALAGDSQYLADAKSYLDREPKNAPYQRITSELLSAMDCMPNANVPEGTLANDDRVYELRLYESPNERLGELKVDMFNSGEVPIFLDSGIQPLFIGQCLIGPNTPSLTYLTVYPNEEARKKAWDAFRAHKDWAVLSKVEKYQGTVSHIDKYVLVAKPYSQM
ncbi:NIPSNAP family protein [Novipirellula caenicola]